MLIHTNHIVPSRQSAAELRDIVYDSEVYQRCTQPLKKMLDGLVDNCSTDPGHHSLGYVQLRLKSGLALADAVDACIEAGDINPDHIRFATFCFRDGYTDLDTPLPSLTTLLGRIDRLCREFGLSALIMPDIELVRLPGYRYPLLSYHHHALVWTSDGALIQPDTLSTAMSERMVGQTLVLSPVKISKRLAGQTAIERVRQIAGYATKVTSRIKRISYNSQGGYHSRASRADLTREQAVRMLHAWSLLNLYGNVSGVGQGKAIRKAWKAAFLQQLSRQGRGNSPVSPLPSQPPTAQHWEKVWACSGVRRYSDEQLATRAGKFDMITAAAETAARRRDSATSGNISAFVAELRSGALSDL